LVLLHLAVALAYSPHIVAPLFDARELGNTDFTVFYTGWTLVRRDPAHLYDADVQRRTQIEILHGAHFPGGMMAFLNPPHLAVALAPMSLVSQRVAFWLWMAFQLVAAATLARWLADLSGLSDRLERWIVGSAVLGFLPLLYTLQIGQLAIFMTLAVVGFLRALHARQDRRAGLWLTLLTIKPQLMIGPLLLVALTRRWRSLAWLCAWSAPVVIATAAVLGPRIWIDYPGHLHHLERFVGAGGYDCMLNLRGSLTRWVGPGHDQTVLAASVAALLIGLAVAYQRLRPHVRDGVLPAGVIAAAFAIVLPLNPHVHLQDGLLWAIPLVACVADRRARGLPMRGFALFALSWPIIYLLTEAVESSTGLLAPISPALLLASALVAWTFRNPAPARTA
jgi:hypothetical protein